MATYSVYVPYSISGASRRADRTVFIREGFSLAAFLFGPLYLLYRRLWLAALGWVLAATLIGFVAHRLDLASPLKAALFVLLALLTGLEATVLRQFGLIRRGYFFAALLACPTLEQAEHGFFNGEGLRDQPSSAPAGAEAPTAARPPEVMGSLFYAGDA